MKGWNRRMFRIKLHIKKFGHQYKGVTYPNINSQKNKRRQWGQKEELKLDRVLYKNKAWQKADIVFWKLLKQKPMFIKKIIETLSIWHLLQCNLCCNPSLGLATKARACEGVGQEWSPRVTFHALESVRKCEGMNRPNLQKTIAGDKTHWNEELFISLEDLET